MSPPRWTEYVLGMGTLGMAYISCEAARPLDGTDAWSVLSSLAVAHGVAGIVWMSSQPKATNASGRLALAVRAHLTFHVLLLLSFVSLLGAGIGYSTNVLAWAVETAFWYVLFGGMLFSCWRFGLARIDAWEASRAADQMVEDLVGQPLEWGFVGTALAMGLAAVGWLPSASEHHRRFAEQALSASCTIPPVAAGLAVYGYAWGRFLHGAPPCRRLASLLKERFLIGVTCLVVVGYIVLLVWLDLAHIPHVGFSVFFLALCVPIVAIVKHICDKPVRWVRLAGDSAALLGAMGLCELAPDPFQTYVVAGVGASGVVTLAVRQFERGRPGSSDAAGGIDRTSARALPWR